MGRPAGRGAGCYRGDGEGDGEAVGGWRLGIRTGAGLDVRRLVVFKGKRAAQCRWPILAGKPRLTVQAEGESVVKVLGYLHGGAMPGIVRGAGVFSERGATAGARGNRIGGDTDTGAAPMVAVAGGVRLVVYLQTALRGLLRLKDEVRLGRTSCARGTRSSKHT